MPKIVVLDGHTLNPGDLSWAPFEAYGEVVVHAHTPEDLIVERAKDAEVIVVNKVVIGAEVMDQLPLLKMIIVSATGMNNIDLSAAKVRGIPVKNVAGYSTHSVAQQVFAYLLWIENRISLHDQAIRNGEWHNQIHFSFSKTEVHELYLKTLGIFGFGTIGQRVAQIALAFGMRVLVHTRYPSDEPNVDFVDIDSLFEQSDYITLHSQLTPERNEMINESLLQKMKRNAWLINTARGGLIHETDLANALDNKWLAGACLDVLSSEPPPIDHPLLNRENVILTPHNAWASIDARARLMNLAAAHLGPSN